MRARNPIGIRALTRRGRTPSCTELDHGLSKWSRYGLGQYRHARL